MQVLMQEKEMPRKSKTFKLDERIITALDRLAKYSGTSANNYLEQLLFKHCQGQGEIPLREPLPVGGRGGARQNAGRPPKPKDTALEAAPEAAPEAARLKAAENATDYLN